MQELSDSMQELFTHSQGSNDEISILYVIHSSDIDNPSSLMKFA